MNYADWAVGVLLVAAGVLVPLAYTYRKHTNLNPNKDDK